MEKTFIITNTLKIVVCNTQLETKIYIKCTDMPAYICMDIDRWTEFKKGFLAIDEEFQKHFNYQYPNL